MLSGTNQANWYIGNHLVIKIDLSIYNCTPEEGCKRDCIKHFANSTNNTKLRKLTILLQVLEGIKETLHIIVNILCLLLEVSLKSFLP